MKKNVEKMFTYLSGYFEGGEMTDALRALSYARTCHENQYRDSGEEYIVHPLRMACHAADIGIKNDEIIAAVLLHDVVEDCGIPLSGLPFNAKIKEIVRYVTVEQREGETKEDMKKRYFSSMLYSPEALIVKGLDRYDNMASMNGFSEERILKNVNETDELFLPLLRTAKTKYPEWRRVFYILRDEIEILSEIHRYYLNSRQ